MTSSNAAAPDPGHSPARGPPPPTTDSATVSANAPELRLESHHQPVPTTAADHHARDHDHGYDLSHNHDRSHNHDDEHAHAPDRHDPDEDHYMPSPPTVSPLSTPAVTHVTIGENADDDVPNMASELPPPAPGAAKASSNHVGMSAEESHPDLDQTPVPDQTRRWRDRIQAVATTDPDPNRMDYSPRNIIPNLQHAQGSIDPTAWTLGLAQATNAIFQTPGPVIVAPSEVSLQASFTQGSEAPTGSADPTSTSASQKLESFARIEFADSVFQMTTYAVIIGRDQRAMDQARRDEKREQNYRRKAEENARNGLPPPTPIHFDRGKFSKSYVSEEGGMLGPESDGEDNVRPAKKHRPSSANRSQNGDDDSQSDHVKSNRQYVSHTPGAAAVDLGTLQPSPNHIPFVGIHSPGPDIASKTRGISRQHLKIEFNEKKGVFEGIALHKNGFFCDDAHYGLNDPVTLRSGDRLQIKDVEFTFIINGVQTGKTGGEEYHDEEETSSKRMSIGGKEMSFDFEHSDHENFQDTSEELSEVENVPTPEFGSEEGEGEGEGEEEGEEEEEDNEAAVSADVKREQPVNTTEPTTSHGEVLSELATADIPKRRGPGRPPKDGIMSKRERRLLKKQMQETAKKTVPQDPQGEKIKRPVGRPRKNPLPEDGDRPEKRKYNKRKPKEEGEEGSDAERRSREKKDKKVRPKSPPLELRKEDFTEEQLQKPSKNYGVLIDEALTNGPAAGLTLKQIYKRIMAKYPWFYFFSETKGWESSVRHNLIGNEAFSKADETGLWSRVPGIELDAGKKRKASSPDRQMGPPHTHSHLPQAQYYQNGSYLPPNNVSFAHGLPSYTTDTKQPQVGYQSPANQVTRPLTAAPSQPIAQPVYPTQAPAPAQLPPGYGSTGLSRQPSATQKNTYSSPYARPPPPPPSNPPVKAENGTPSNLQALPATPGQQPTTQISPQQQQPASSIQNGAPRQQLSPEIEKAIARFRANMLEVLSKQTPHAAQIIDSAINRARGLPVYNSVPGFESVEMTLVNPVQKMISDLQAQQRKVTSASPAPPTTAPTKSTPTPSPAPTVAMEAEIQRRIKNFRDNMLVALKTKTNRAEIIIDSAINRAQGLPHAGKVQGWEEADNLMVKSITQIITDVRKAHGRQPQQASSPSTASNRPAHPSQSTQSAPRQVPSASPAPAPSSTPTSAVAQPSNGTTPATPVPNSSAQAISACTPKPATPSISRPGISIQRPTSVGISRPAVNSIPRPPVACQTAVTASSAAPVITSPAPQIHSVSSPAPPSAGVVDQITGQKRQVDDVHKNSNDNGVTTHPDPVVKVPTSAHSVSSPAPPSAGVVDQIAGQKRPLDDGPGSSCTEQPELKKVAVSTT
ncbi:hypothetical protein F5X99DRAFT_378452 [Biscogniauxia marginata]|nr:hypothetical protein F5X99DRAFT_378452 [Biscogniauxia marginata]